MDPDGSPTEATPPDGADDEGQSPDGADEEQPEAQNAALVQLVARHLPLLVTLGGFLLAMLKVYRVAHGNTETALAMVHAVGPTSILFAAVLSVLNSLMFLFIYWTTIAVANKWGTRAQRRLLIDVATFVFVLEGYAFGFWKSLLGLLVVVAVAVGFWFLGHKFGKGWNHYSSPELLSVVPVLLASTFITSQPWVPAEQLSLVHGAPVVAYVLSDQGRWMTVLKDEPRVVVSIPESDVVRREPCSQTNTDVPPVCPSPSSSP